MANEVACDALGKFLHDETDPKSFHHRDHVQMAFELLKRHPNFVDAAAVYSLSLRKIAARAGNPAAYHETITLAFLSLIAERTASCNHKSFEQFAARNADLLDKQALTRWYSAERLGSEIARQTFILPTPDRT